MNRGRTVFAQLLGFIPFGHFEHLVDRFAANRGVSEFTAWSLLCMTYAQSTRREGLRDLGLRAVVIHTLTSFTSSRWNSRLYCR